MFIEKGKITGTITVEKFRGGGKEPYEIIKCENLVLTSGINELLNLAIGGSSNHFDNATAQIGIGDNKTTAPAYTQTDLQAATNKTYKAMESGYPSTPANREVQFKSVFGSADANYEWGEFVIRQSTSLVCLNRSTNSGIGWGTKQSGDIWTVTVKFNIS